VAPAVPPIPAIPELSVAKRDDQRAAAKIAVFAYHRESRQALWQSGIAQASSTAKDVWLLGAGPFKQGTIYDHATFAGADLSLSLGAEDEKVAPAIELEDAHIFDALRKEQKSKVRVVNFDEPVNE
jgi:hypothetical protein